MIKRKTISEDDIQFLTIEEKEKKEETHDKTNKHYIKNKDLQIVFLEYGREKQRCLDEGLPKPILPDEIARSIVLVANRMASKYTFNRYTFKEDSIGDGILECLTYIDNYNAEKYNNPFAYISQLIKNAFYKRSTKESIHQYTQLKIYDGSSIFKERVEHADDINSSGTETDFFDDYMTRLNSLEAFIESRKAKSTKRIKNINENSVLNKFIMEDKDE